MEQRKEYIKKKLRLALEFVRLLRERNAALQQYNEILLFSKAPSGGNEADLVAYFDLKRNEALQKASVRLRDSATATDGTNDNVVTEERQQSAQQSRLPETNTEREIMPPGNGEIPGPGIGIRN